MKDSLYQRYKLRQEVINKGIRDTVDSWVDKLAKGEEFYRSYFDAGFKDLRLVEVARDIEPSKLKPIKEQFMALGADEETAERWMSIGDFKGALEFYKKGYSFEEALRYLRHRRSVNFIEKVIKLLQEQGLTKEEAREDFYQFLEGNLAFRMIQEKIVNTIEETKQKGYKSMYLFRMVSFEKPEEEKVQERIRWYMSLGLSRLQAEWWTATEIWYKKELSEVEAKAWLSAGVKKLQDIIEVVRMMKNNDHEKNKNNRGLSLDELIRWYKAGIHNPWKWMKLGHTPESASYWEIKNVEVRPEIEPEVFEELLKESLCGKRELAKWLEVEEYNVEGIKEWLSAGVKDIETYSALTKLGFELEEVKKLLEVFSLEKLLQMIDDGKTKKEIFREYSEKQIMKKVVGLFRKKL